MLKQVLRNSFFCTLFIFFMMWIFSMVPFPEIEILDPIGQTLNDFDITDLAYNKVKGYVHKQKDAKGHELNINQEEGDTNVVVVNIGEKSRQDIAKMINIISAMEPKVIGLDAIFDGRRDTLGDLMLSDAIKNSGKVILASKFMYDKSSTEENPNLNLQKSDPLFSGVTQNSYVNLVTDGSDDIAKYKTSRSFYPKIVYKKQMMNFFAVDIVQRAYPDKAKKFLAREHEIEYINYLGNIGGYGDALIHDVPKFFAIDCEPVLNIEFDPSIFKNKIVLMGFLGRRIGEQDIEDIFYSPLNEKYIGKTNPDMFGVVIHANIINMILQERYIQQVPTWLKIILAVVICYISVCVLYIAFLAYPLMYGTLSKLIQFVFWISILFFIIGMFYNYRLKYDADIAVVTVLLAGDMVEIYHELVLPAMVKLYRLFFVKKRVFGKT